jgi:hypothetical protein
MPKLFFRGDGQQQHPEAVRAGKEDQQEHARGPEQVGDDHGLPFAPPVGEDACGRAEDDHRDDLGHESQAGIAGGVGELEDVDGDGDD